MNCSKCGREAKKDEMFTGSVPAHNWWLHLTDGPAYCDACWKELRKERGAIVRTAKRREINEKDR